MTLRPKIGWLAILLAWCPFSPVISKESAEAEPQISVRVSALIDRAMARAEAVGLSYAVIRDNRILLVGHAGLANTEQAIAVSNDTLFRIASITKQFTAAAILLLAERGRLELDQPASRYIVELDTDDRQPTIRQLLNHTSGLPDVITGTCDLAYRIGSKRQANAPELQPLIYQFEPGARWSYSNCGYLLLGELIEVVDGRSYAKFIQEEFSRPLGLRNTFVEIPHTRSSQLATGYRLGVGDVDFLVREDLDPGNFQPAAGIVSSAADMARWQLSLIRGEIISRASFKSMILSATETDDRSPSYGLGLMVRQSSNGFSVGHTGNVRGSNNVAMWYPRTGYFIVILSNSETFPSAMLEQQISELLEGELDCRERGNDGLCTALAETS